MNRYSALLFAVAMTLGASLAAQDTNQKFKQIDMLGPSPSPSPASSPQPNPAAPEAPTVIIASKESTFDNATKVAVLYGDVKVNNPQFTLSSDKLTVYFHKEDEAPQKGATPKKQGSPTPKPTGSPTPKPGAGDPSSGSGNIDKIIAEGNVVIISDRPDPKGGPPVHYIGKGTKVVYTPATGEAVLSGMPELQQGTNTMVANDESTVIYLSRDGKMHADGPVKMKVANPPPDSPSPTPVPDKTPEIR